MRYSDRVYTDRWSDSVIDDYARDEGLRSINNCDENEECIHTFGDKHLSMDERKLQMENKTPLELYFKNENNGKFEYTGKRFIITDIEIGGIDGFDNNFNKFICELKRIPDNDIKGISRNTNNMDVSIDISHATIKTLKYNIKKKLFLRIKDCIIKNINGQIIKSLKTTMGDTQRKERISIYFIKKCLDILNYSYEEAGSQQSKDFRNINNIGMNIEVKKTDSTTVYFNDTLPSLDIFYIIIFTGKEYKTKKNISPKLIFINGYDLCKPDLYLLFEYKKDMDYMKNKWGRKKCGGNATKFKHFSVYPRPTYKTDISYLINSDYSYNLN